ncbi:hypothetical protein FOCC_FOCC002166 [Frankliniella occidentalis]|nr:hypothetical protein FOCC_FOCC002166 [Frankliniella occidentalis]
MTIGVCLNTATYPKRFPRKPLEEFNFFSASAIKATHFALDSGLAGVALFTIDNDDYMGTCGAKYPLLRAAQQALNDRD